MRAYDFNFLPNANKLCYLIVPHICAHLVDSRGHSLTNWIFRTQVRIVRQRVMYKVQTITTKP